MKLGSNATEQLNKLGIPQDVVVGQMQKLDRSSLARLSRLGNGFGRMAIGESVRVNKFSRQVKDARQDVPKAWANPSPSQVLKTRGPFVEGTYYQERPEIHPSANDPMPALFNRHRRHGAVMVQRLLGDDITLKAFERATQLEVVNDGRRDGAVSVSAMTGNAAASSGYGVPPQTMFDVLMQMDEAIMKEAASLGLGVTGASDWLFSGDTVGSSNGSSSYGMNDNTATGSQASDDNASSVDLMTFELKRLMDKKTQAYDLVRSVFDKHNEAAKQAINNMKA